jgi:hypothetical protein
MLIPIGPPAPGFPPSGGTALGTSAGGAPVQITVNNGRPVTADTPPDPNAATSASGVVLSTYNLPGATTAGISYSTDNGMTFTDVNLGNAVAGRTSFFPQSDSGLCCDQVVVYLPNQDLFVWLLQYWPATQCVTNCGPPPAMNATFKITATNRVRIAWASPAAIKADFNNAWTYADLTPNAVAGVDSGLGAMSNEWVDYPDLAWSDNFLYVSVDHGTPAVKVYTGKRLVARMSLADISNSASTVVHYDYAELSGSNGLNKDHFVQRAPDRMVVGSLDNSSTFRVFTWDDNSGSINNSTVGLSTGINQGNNYTSTAPDGTDWIKISFPGNVTGAVYRSVIPGLGVPSQDQYLFAFDAGVNAPNRPNAYVRLETLTPSGGGFGVLEEYDIWNGNFAFAMAALARDDELVMPDVAMNLAVGGGTVGYPQMSVGFKDDFIVFQVTNSNAAQPSRFGDYLSTRFIAGKGNFDAEAYDVILNPVPMGGTPTCAAVGCAPKPRYIQFGRPPFKPPS